MEESVIFRGLRSHPFWGFCLWVETRSNEREKQRGKQTQRLWSQCMLALFKTQEGGGSGEIAVNNRKVGSTVMEKLPGQNQVIRNLVNCKNRSSDYILIMRRGHLRMLKSQVRVWHLKASFSVEDRELDFRENLRGNSEDSWYILGNNEVAFD